jgi:hypothetical protein
VKLKFWLFVLDAIASLGLFGSPLYLWAVKASDATDWGHGADCGGEGEPF